MTNYQFRCYEACRDKCDQLLNEIKASLPEGKLMQVKPIISEHVDSFYERPFAEGETGMTDFQYRTHLDALYELIKLGFEAGKSPEEVMELIADVKNRPNEV